MSLGVMKGYDMSFVIFDTEYTSWKGCLEHGWQGNQKKELVQIAALKVSDDLSVIAKFNALCKPKINPVLSDYFVNLTCISNEQIAQNGKQFSDVYEAFLQFVGSNICYSHAWGGDFFHKSDGKIMDENCTLYNVTPQKEIVYRNIAPVFEKLYEKNNIQVKSQSSGQIAQILHIEQKLAALNLNPHNAYYDVYSILEGLRYFYPQSIEILNAMEKFL